MAQARRAKPRPSRVILPLAVAAALLVGGSVAAWQFWPESPTAAEPHETPAVAATESTAVPTTTPRATATPSSHPDADRLRRPRPGQRRRRSRPWTTAGTGYGPRTRCWTRPAGDRPLGGPRRGRTQGRGSEHLGGQAAGDLQADPAGRSVGPAALRRRGQRPRTDRGLLRQGRGRRRHDQDRDGQVPRAKQGAEAGAGGRGRAMRDWKNHLADMQRSRETHVKNAQGVWLRAYGRLPRNQRVREGRSTSSTPPAAEAPG